MARGNSRSDRDSEYEQTVLWPCIVAVLAAAAVVLFYASGELDSESESELDSSESSPSPPQRDSISSGRRRRSRDSEARARGRKRRRMDQDDLRVSFQLLTTLIYRPAGHDLGPTWSALSLDPSDTAPLLRKRHVPRLRRAREELAKSVSSASWCSDIGEIDEEEVVAEVFRACEAVDRNKALRVSSHFAICIGER
jgi:hypothetical protein